MTLLHRYFEQQADLHPENIALNCNGDLLTYKEIERRANQMAHWLLAEGVRRGQLIALLLECSVDFYVASLAILKVGAAYVPIDQNYPVERIEYMLENAKVEMLLTVSQYKDTLQSNCCRILNIDLLQKVIADNPEVRLDLFSDTDDLCYVIYTSGTTGKPKGVAIKHRSVCNYVESALSIYGINATDRVYQGFSIAFDASIEEIWIAFASGATLVVGTNNSVHAGAGLIDFLNFHQVTVFSTVPTMLALLEGEVRSLRVLILGGEVCTAELISRWARPGLKIYNTYGPTEATIIASYAECLPEKTITIGRPLPNCEIIILNENLKIVEDNEYGELCIGGVCLAAGYVNNPDLTANKFISHPLKPNERIYRSGDRARFNTDGNIELAGRFDDQIKLRGFRVELSEIEGVLQQYPGIRRAVVNASEVVRRIDTLVAYLILKPDTEIVTEDIISYLNSRLPTYMIPTMFEIVSSLPLLPSGKVDRKNLPKPTVHTDEVTNDYVAPRTPTEKKITTIWENVFKHAPISIKLNFFHDLGGHSLTAANVISLLRRNKEMRQVSIIDLFENPTIEKLAERLDKAKEEEIEKNEEINPTHKSLTLGYKARFHLCSVAQLFGLYVQFALSSWQLLIIFLLLSTKIEKSGLISLQFFTTLLLMVLLLQPILLGIVVITKWLLLGRIKPGKYKLWGWFYLRWWIVQQLLDLASTNFLTGSPLVTYYYRLLGAKIGKNCYIDTTNINAFDLFSMGDDSSLGTDVIAQGYTVEYGFLKIGTIQIGKRCYVGNSSVLGINTTICDDAKLGEQSMLPEGSTLLQNESYIGSPARLGKVNLPDIDKAQKTTVPNKPAQVFMCHLLYYLALFYILVIYCIAVIPGVLLLDYFCLVQPSVLNCLWAIPLSGFLFFMLIGCLVVLNKKFLIGTIKSGCYKLESRYYIKKWFCDKLLDLTFDISYALYATMYAPSWFRLLGAKIGKRTELSTITASTPDLLSIGDECFIADGGVVGASRVYQGCMQLAPVKLQNRVFVGNSAFVPMNTHLEENCLIACLSIPPYEEVVAANTSWFGSPAMHLPRRDIFTGFSEKLTYLPSLRLLLTRACIDLIKIMLPPIFFFSMLALNFMAIHLLLGHTNPLSLFLLFPLIEAAVVIGFNMIIVLMKWVLMKRYVATAKPAWSVYVWLNELITGLYDSFSTPTLLDGLRGTPYLAVFLRLLGAKIGRRVYIDTTFFSEFDLVEIKKDVCLNTECTIQTHLFEDRVLKMAPLKIEEGCTVGSRSIVLYNTIMEKRSSLTDLSLLMKGEILPAYSQWEGIPAQHK